MKLERNGKNPLHFQIQSLIREQIAQGLIKAGENIPSERELSEKLKVSRMTVRQAFKALREEGLVYQKRGTGTFASPHKLDIHTRNLTGFSDEMRRRGMEPSSKVLSLKKELPETDVMKQLNISQPDTVFHLERLRLANEIPMSIETTYLPVSIFPKLDQYNYEKESLYHVLENNYGMTMYSAEEILEAATSDQQTSQLLGIKRNSPLLIVHRTVFTETDKAIEYTKSVYRADRYRASFFLVKK
jgi:GntR family transcriptional regulator